MRYADLKRERDEAIARAVEAERLSMKSEVDRLQQAHETEKAALYTEIRGLRAEVVRHLEAALSLATALDQMASSIRVDVERACARELEAAERVEGAP